MEYDERDRQMEAALDAMPEDKRDAFIRECVQKFTKHFFSHVGTTAATWLIEHHTPGNMAAAARLVALVKERVATELPELFTQQQNAYAAGTVTADQSYEQIMARGAQIGVELAQQLALELAPTGTAQ